MFAGQPSYVKEKTLGWWKDFENLEEAKTEMVDAAKFCQTHDFGPCNHCSPF